MGAKSKMPAKIAGYTIFPVALPALPQLPFSATHYMYMKPHEPKVSSPDTLRSLFVTNVPFDATESHFKYSLSTQLGLSAGRIAAVEFHERNEPYIEERTIVPSLPSNAPSKKRKREMEIVEGLPPLDPPLPPVWDRTLHHPGTNAVVTFVDKASMDAALKAVQAAAKTDKKAVWRDGAEAVTPDLGSARYAEHVELLYPGTEALKEYAEEYLAAFDAHTTAKNRILAEQRQLPDEDGFVTVTRTSNKGGVRAVKQDVAKERLAKQKAKEEELTDFYRFQGREKAKERAKELISKFQEDVEKVQKMRERRGKMQIK